MGLRIPSGRTLGFFFFGNDIPQADFLPRRRDILNRKRHSNRPAVLALIALTSIWGYNWVVMKECLKYAGVYDFAALRTGIGAVSLFALLLWKRRPLRPKAIWMTVLLGFLSTTAVIGLVTLALATGGVGKTAILVYIMPFWVLLMAWPLLSEKIRGIQWISVVMALVGLMIILEPWHLQSTFISKLFAVLAGVAWALSTIVTKIMNRKNHLRSHLADGLADAAGVSAAHPARDDHSGQTGAMDPLFHCRSFFQFDHQSGPGTAALVFHPE